MPLFSLDDQTIVAGRRSEETALRITRPFGRQSIPELVRARLASSSRATRPSLFNLRMLSAPHRRISRSSSSRRRLSVVSTHHYVNHGGSELVLYRATPAGCAIRRARRRPRVSRLSGRRRRRRRPAADGLLRAAARTGHRGRQSPSSPATKSGTKPRPRSSTTCFRSRFAGAASCSTIAFCSASCRNPAALAGTEARRPTTCSRIF